VYIFLVSIFGEKSTSFIVLLGTLYPPAPTGILGALTASTSMSFNSS